MEGSDGLGPGAAEELDDTALRQEIELLAELLETVADAPQPLCQAEIDRALHVTDVPEQPGPATGTGRAGRLRHPRVGGQ